MGVEAEGRLKGVPTVFARKVDPTAINIAVAKGISHIYFGFRCERLTATDYSALLSMLPVLDAKKFLITMHIPMEDMVNVPSFVWGRCHVMLYQTVPFPQILGGDVEVRLEHDTCAAVYGRPEVISTLYVHDRPAR